mgnify:FL=1
MIPLSQAIRRHPNRHPLDAALLSVQTSAEWSIRALHNLHTAWPHLGESVRRWPTLAAELEDADIIPPVRKWSNKSREEIHVALWQVLCLLHDKADCTNVEIADILKARGL